jgi:hypothetical protein
MTWKETAVLELAAYEGFRPGDMEVSEDNSTFGADIWVDIGRRQYLVFKDEDAAERGAVLYVKDMLEDDASMFNQEWLKGFLFLSPPDQRLTAIDLVGERFTDREMSDEEVIEYAGAEDEVEKAVEALEEAVEEANERYTEGYDEADEEEEKRLSDAVDAAEAALEEGQEAAVAQVAEAQRDDLRSDAIDQIAEELKDDPVGYFEMHFGDTAADLLERNVLSIDLDKAAQAAVDEDGVGHFLSGYDGNQIDLDSGAVAFRHN